MEYDSKTKMFFSEALSPVVTTADGASVGSIIDTQDFESLTFILHVALRTSGTYTVTIEDGDDSGLSDTAAVTVADDPQTIIPALAAQLARSTDGVTRFGYIGKKRFVRVTVTTSAFSVTGATIAVHAILGNAQSGPTTDQAGS